MLRTINAGLSIYICSTQLQCTHRTTSFPQVTPWAFKSCLAEVTAPSLLYITVGLCLKSLKRLIVAAQWLCGCLLATFDSPTEDQQNSIFNLCFDELREFFNQVSESWRSPVHGFHKVLHQT